MNNNKVAPSQVPSQLSADEEITQVRQKPAEVIALRQQLYRVVADRPEDGIQEVDPAQVGQVTLEDEGSNEYYTYDYSAAAVRYATATLADREAAEAESEKEEDAPSEPPSLDDELVFVEDFDEGSGFTPAEEAFFR